MVMAVVGAAALAIAPPIFAGWRIEASRHPWRLLGWVLAGLLTVIGAAVGLVVLGGPYPASHGETVHALKFLAGSTASISGFYLGLTWMARRLWRRTRNWLLAWLLPGVLLLVSLPVLLWLLLIVALGVAGLSCGPDDSNCPI